MMVLANEKVEKDGVKRLPRPIGGHFSQQSGRVGERHWPMRLENTVGSCEKGKNRPKKGKNRSGGSRGALAIKKRKIEAPRFGQLEKKD